MLAALALWKIHGQCDPDNRAPNIDILATDDGRYELLDAKEIELMMDYINTVCPDLVFTDLFERIVAWEPAIGPAAAVFLAQIQKECRDAVVEARRRVVEIDAEKAAAAAARETTAAGPPN